MVTIDLSKFGPSELKTVEALLKAWRHQGLPEDFHNDEIKIMFNLQSGFVFLTNSDFQVAMLNGESLEIFYNCPICGHEGFLEEMAHGADNPECREYLQQIGYFDQV